MIIPFNNVSHAQYIDGYPHIDGYPIIIEIPQSEIIPCLSHQKYPIDGDPNISITP